MKIDVQLTIAAPPSVVFRFFSMLDHLRFISPKRRTEWCPRRGTVVALGMEADLRVQQGRRSITLRFRNVGFDLDRRMEDEFVSWPLRGARHIQTFEPENGGDGTHVDSETVWDPPWYLRKVLERRLDEQRAFFQERLENAKRIIESAYRIRGAAAFADGIFPDTERIGIAPIVTAD